MSQTGNDAIVTQFRQVAATGDFQPFNELFADDAVRAMFDAEAYVQAEEDMTAGVPGVLEFTEELRRAFGDLRTRFDDVIADGDRLVLRATYQGTHTGEFRGVASTGNRVEFERIDIWQMRDGRFVEHWGKWNLLWLLRQLDAVSEFPRFRRSADALGA